MQDPLKLCTGILPIIGFFGSLYRFASKQYKQHLLFAPGPPLSFSFGHQREKICAGRVTMYVLMTMSVHNATVVSVIVVGIFFSGP